MIRQMARRASAIVLLALLAGLPAVFLAGCTSDAPTTPKPVHYNIYAAVSSYQYGDTSSTLFIYDADSLTLLDTLVLPNIADWAAASPDGRALYLGYWGYKAGPYSHYAAKLDLTSKMTEWIHELNAPGNGERVPVQLMDNGRLIVYGRETIDPATGETLRRMTDDEAEHWKWQHGPPGGDEVAVLWRGAYSHDTLIEVEALRTGTRRGYYVPRLGPTGRAMGVFTARLHPDGRRVLAVCARYSNQDAWFVVGDVTTGTTEMAAQVSTWFTEIAISTDGTLAVVVDYANLFFMYGWPSMYVYDLVDYRRLAMFDGYGDPLRVIPGQVRFLPPGDRRVVIAPDNGITGLGWLQTFDLNSLTSEYVVDTPFFEPYMGALAVGPRLEE